ncbi:amidase [Mycolicibacterium holsaticum]|uniref:amidase n=1 Tax=Mycolicibacterium holsaticum TaxID=152142 RepID=UPI001C7D393B|nr:amidase [Mycolicibacterium holsaticum]MDA4108200.1 amidase [Mycolicibacterium holsaticum DSM 44478 = JCM 12374]QZA14395.1 amidase [Mycolicibacterium holsaticum DSM 44478 = JCM 12374]UNC08155.1 amidase [Mycolicibacterium holsaticum DSM 44478 = JCM 12374]
MVDTARFPTLTQQLFRLASGSVTSVELTRRSLDAIEASQPTLNAFRVVLREEALADAAAADRKRAAGEQLPLLGIPIAVKDDVDVAGVPTRFGTDGTVRRASQDAEVVRRLRAAGAVIVGKTNTCELGQWPFTSGPGFGHTRNPWSCEHTPGGSSGGSAAAVAAGLVTAAIGSDGAGSVRIPAAWTHLVGIKPQRGRISTWPLPEAFNGITVNGVLARTVADAAIVLDAASGNVPGDLHQPPPVRVSDSVAQAPGPLRIAMSTKFPFTGFRASLHPEIRAAMQAVAAQLGELGHTVTENDPSYSLGMSWNFLSRSTSGLLDWADRLGYGVRLDARTKSNLRMGRLLSENVLRKARAREAAAQRRMGWIFNIADVVLAPTTAQPPPLVHDFDHRGGLSTDRTMIKACPVTWPWNLLGWPSINVPAGFTSAGLPIGVQLMGPANSEPLLVSLAAELEAINGWAMKQPQPWWTAGPAPDPTPTGRNEPDIVGSISDEVA